MQYAIDAFAEAIGVLRTLIPLLGCIALCTSLSAMVTPSNTLSLVTSTSCLIPGMAIICRPGKDELSPRRADFHRLTTVQRIMAAELSYESQNWTAIALNIAHSRLVASDLVTIVHHTEHMLENREIIEETLIHLLTDLKIALRNLQSVGVASHVTINRCVNSYIPFHRASD